MHLLLYKQYIIYTDKYASSDFVSEMFIGNVDYRNTNTVGELKALYTDHSKWWFPNKPDALFETSSPGFAAVLKELQIVRMMVRVEGEDISDDATKLTWNQLYRFCAAWPTEGV